jgi:hypothetical protein
MDSLHDGWSMQGEDALAHWPKGADGTPEKSAFLVNLTDAGGIADMTVSQLSAYGIPAFKDYPKGGGGRVILGFSAYGADLYVPASRLEEAQALLEEAHSEEP